MNPSTQTCVLPSYPEEHDILKKARSRYNGRVGLNTALAELGLRPTAATFRNKVTGEFDKLLPFKDEGGTVARADWESLYLQVQQRLGDTLPIWNADALPRPDLFASKDSKELDFLHLQRHHENAY